MNDLTLNIRYNIVNNLSSPVGGTGWNWYFCTIQLPKFIYIIYNNTTDVIFLPIARQILNEKILNETS